MEAIGIVAKEQFDYTMNEIRKNRGLYQMANEQLAEEMLPYIQQILPEVRLIKYNIYQWYATDLKALKRLEKELQRIKKQKTKELEEINNAILQLQSW